MSTYHIQHILLPKLAACSLRFLQQLLTGEKSCMERGSIPRIIVPNLPELAVKKVWSICMSMPDFKYYIPDNWAPEGRRNDRDFFWTVAAFIDYDFVVSLIKEARKKRGDAKQSRVVTVEQPTIMLRPEMAALLLRDDEFRASKCHDNVTVTRGPKEEPIDTAAESSEECSESAAAAANSLDDST